MKKKLAWSVIVGCFGILMPLISYSQDLIVTHDNDSLNVSIEKVKSYGIQFLFYDSTEVKQSFIPIAQIKTYKWDYFKTSDIPMGYQIGSSYPKWCISAGGGYSYRLAKIPENLSYDIEEYIKQLKSGYHLGGSVTYFPSEIFGFGIKSDVFFASNSMENVPYYLDNQFQGYTRIADDISMFYLGASFAMRWFNLVSKESVLFSFSIGYQNYKNDSFFIVPLQITGNTLGITTDLSYNFPISKELSLGIYLGIHAGSLTEIQVESAGYKETIEFDEGDFESLSRIDVGIQLSWIK